MVDCKSLGRAAVLGLSLAAAACQSGQGAGGILSVGRAKPIDIEAEQAKIDAAELRAYCPRVSIPSYAAVINRFEKGAEDDRDRLIYQSSISDVTRACTYGQGTLTLNVAVAGRVVAGPVGASQTVSIPIKIEVMQADGQVLYSQVHQQQVQTQPSAGASQFVFSDPNVTIPMPSAKNLRVFAGFDVPPPKREEL